jgi:hypothetical protein
MAVRRALALAVALGLTSGCSLAGRTLGVYVDDALVKGAVKRRLADQGTDRRAGVTVDTFGGTVYLSGLVETAQQKSDAEVAAWQVDGVRQVVNDLVVGGHGNVPSASAAALALHPVRNRLPGVARVEPGRPEGPDLAYDAAGRVIATVYTLSSRELIDRDTETLRSDGRRIDHVSIFPVVGAELPAPRYAVVLWHVSEPEAAGLR